MKGLLVLEHFYDRNLREYYKALQMGLSHNYYYGRHDADITYWLGYFLKGLAEVYSHAAQIVQEKNEELLRVEPERIRRLDLQQRRLFRQMTFKQDEITSKEIMKLLDMGDRTAREKIKQWIDAGFIQPKDPNAQRIRTVVLSDRYKELADQVRDNVKQYGYLLSEGDK